MRVLSAQLTQRHVHVGQQQQQCVKVGWKSAQLAQGHVRVGQQQHPVKRRA